MEMIKRVNRLSAIVLISLAALSALIEWKRLPLGIVIGGAAALINLRGLHWGVSGLMNPETAGSAKGRLVFFSMFRLFLLVAFLGMLVYLRIVNVIGILVGLTVVFIAIMKEGLTEAKRL